MRTARLLVVLLSLTLGVLLAACQQAGESDIGRTNEGVMRLGSVEVVDTVARAVSLNDRPLVLKGLRGSVRLMGAEQTTANLTFVRRGRGESREAGQSVLEGISITESGTGAKYTYTLAAEKKKYAAVDIRGEVPRSAALRIDRLSGPVRIDGVRGKLTIEHKHGDVLVLDAAAPVEVTLKNGDVQVGFRTVPEEGPIRLETSNGDLRLRLPPNASAQIDAQTDAGTIRTQNLSFATERFVPVNAGARYNAQLGEGGPTIELRTQNGSITIQARDSARADTMAATQTPAPDTTVSPRPASDTQRVDTLTADTTASDTSS
ncbi:MAG: DUF4097 family beta strand repeat-containing protein [Salinibacter sp.]